MAEPTPCTETIVEPDAAAVAKACELLRAALKGDTAAALVIAQSGWGPAERPRA